MRLATPAFRLELAPAQAADAADWARVRVRAESGGFHGDFEAAVQAEDLRRFERELRAMEESAARPARATLSCAEPGLDVRLDLDAPGAVAGHFALGSPRGDGAWTTLSGTFELDPVELPALRASMRALLDALRGQAPA
jgi:hypothetical protein